MSPSDLHLVHLYHAVDQLHEAVTKIRISAVPLPEFERVARLMWFERIDQVALSYLPGEWAKYLGTKTEGES